MQEFSDKGQLALSTIDSIYGTEQGSEIPFVGITGEDKITEYLSYGIEDAQESVDIFMPRHFMQDTIISSMQEASEKVPVAVICREEEHAIDLVNETPNAQVYLLETSVFERLMQVGEMIKSFLPPDEQNSYSFGIIQGLLQNFSDIFGLAVFDQRKSFFLVPIRVGFPIAIISTMPEMLRFHTEGIQAILESARQVN
jgi:hypothetical protein